VRDSRDARSFLNCPALQAHAPGGSACSFPESGKYRCIFLCLPSLAINYPILLRTDGCKLMTRKALRSGEWSFPASKRPVLRIIIIRRLMDIHSWGLRFLEIWSTLVPDLTYILNTVNHLDDKICRIVSSKLSPILLASPRIPNRHAPAMRVCCLLPLASGNGSA
jgi:hypothetical protein